MGEADSLAGIRRTFERQTFMQLIGARLIRVEPGVAEIEIVRDERLLQQNGFIHGGVITSLLDTACGIASQTMMDEGCDVLTVEFKVNLLAPAVGERFLARGTVLKAGRKIVVSRGDAFAIAGGESRLIGAMQASMIAVRDESNTSPKS